VLVIGAVATWAAVGVTVIVQLVHDAASWSRPCTRCRPSVPLEAAKMSKLSFVNQASSR